eukprot:c7037_g1_i1 orf=80-250(+)
MIFFLLSKDKGPRLIQNKFWTPTLMGKDSLSLCFYLYYSTSPAFAKQGHQTLPNRT